MDTQVKTRLQKLEETDLPNLSNQSNHRDFNESFNAIRDEFGQVKEMIDDIVFEGGDAGLEETYNQLRTKFRSISLSTKRNIDSGAHGEELLGNATKERYSDDSELTSNLNKTATMLRSNLDQSITNHQIWEDSSSLINTTLNQYVDFDGLLLNSKHLLRKLERGNMLDRLLILVSILFFLFCVLVVLKRRVYNRGMSLLGLLFKPFTATQQPSEYTEHTEHTEHTEL